MKILIVEDEEILIKVLQEKLEKENFTVAWERSTTLSKRNIR